MTALVPTPESKCENWLNFLNNAIGDPVNIAQLQEFFGYCLMRETRYEKSLVIVGGPQAGKSVVLKILRAVCGPQNCTAVPIDWLDDLFCRAELHGKLVNFSDGFPVNIVDLEYFKKFVSGDLLTAAFKHQDCFDYKPFVKLVITANHLPEVNDNTDGYYRRLLIIHFKERFVEEDPYLVEKLQSEIYYILNWAVAGLLRLLEQDGFQRKVLSDDENKQ